MRTETERARILGAACRMCGAKPGEPCHSVSPAEAGKPWPARTIADFHAVRALAAAQAQQLTPECIESAQEVVERPEYWCRAKLFRALSAAMEKGVLQEALDEMDLPPGESARITLHLARHWRLS